MPPLDGKQNVSRGTDLYNHQKGYTNEELLKMKFSEGEVLSKNHGKDVSLSELASDDRSYTGPNTGFYAQNTQLRKKLIK